MQVEWDESAIASYGEEIGVEGDEGGIYSGVVALLAVFEEGV